MLYATQNVEAPGTISQHLLRISSSYSQTPLISLPRLAQSLNISTVLAKDETSRTLGSFKSLGGTYAGLRAIARFLGCTIPHLFERPLETDRMPTLLTASAGNHGLAVAAAARFAGAKAKVFLYPGVSVQREKRIADQGAEIVRVDGTYDDAVAATKRAAASGEGILVADTSSDINDVGVADIMAGYGILAHEIKSQVADDVSMHPTHVFVQAGVGGLAAAIATGLADWPMENSTTFIVVEPQTAACLAAAIEARQPVRISGDLDTVATMLACGEASAPALQVLQDRAKAISASEQLLQQAPQVLAEFGGPVSTPSGAAGLAGLLAASRDPEWRAKLNLNSSSKALLLITEGAINS